MGVFQVEGCGDAARADGPCAPPSSSTSWPPSRSTAPARWSSSPTTSPCCTGRRRRSTSIRCLEPILAETMGVCVYQEQVIQILTDIAGYTAGEADLVRRGISKKARKVLDEHREIFAKGAAEKSGAEPQGGGRDLGCPDGLCPLRLQPRPRRRLCRHRGPDRLPQGLLPGRVHGGPAHHRAPRHGKGRRR